ncbi:MAG: DUF3568 family protein [Nitrospiraceae bacterium]|nr:DUF3568 family protein [Nitrospiraceae bacterium]
MLRRRLAIWVLAVLLVPSACTTIKYESVGAPVKTPEYSFGYLKANLDKPLADVYEATRDAYKDLGIKVVKAKADKLTGAVSGDLASGTTATTDLTALTEKLTAVSIRVGATGNEGFSRRIYDRIEKHL